MYIPLPLGAQTAYAELLDQARSLEFSRFANLRGSFAIRNLRGRDYVYFGYRDADGLGRMAYVGPGSPRIQKLIADFETGKAPKQLSPLVRSATALGVAPIVEKHFRVVKQLSDYGFFKAGGLLIGTHAFIATANML